MSSMTETEKVNLKVAQLKMVLDKNFLKQRYNIKFIFERIDDINYRIASTDYLKSHHSKWIGSSALHFPFKDKDLEAINILLSHGADFTIANSIGSTGLHQFVEENPLSISEPFNPSNEFVHSAVSIHVKYNILANPVNSSGLSHFHVACAVNNVEVVKVFLQNGVSVNQIVKTDSPVFAGFTPLHFAVKNCAIEVAEELILHGSNMYIEDGKGMTPLHVALEQKLNIRSREKKFIDRCDKLFELLLAYRSKDGKITIGNYGLSHFHLACASVDSKTAEHLLKEVADINRTLSMDSPLWPGYSALHFAALCNLDTVKLLMKNGADISMKDANGVTAFDLCIEKYGAEDISAIISLHPIWKNIVLSDFKTKLTDVVLALRDFDRIHQYSQRLCEDLNIEDSPLWPGCTLMHLAVIFFKGPSRSVYLQYIDENRIITRRKVNVWNVCHLISLCRQNPTMIHSQDVHGRTPLHLAFHLNKRSACAVLLQHSYASDSNLTDHIDEDGLSFLHITAAQNDILTLERLLTTGSDVNGVYRGKPFPSVGIHPGSTPLHFAVANESVEAAVALIKNGADVCARDDNDMTSIHLLLLKRNEKLADVLLDTPNLMDSVVRGVGLSHLHVACLCGKPKHVESLLENGADINRVMAREAKETFSKLPFLEKYAGHSPLLLVYDCNSNCTVEMLLKSGADVFIPYEDGKPLLYSVLETDHAAYLDEFVQALKKSEDIQVRMKAETGITDLHFACLFEDDKSIRKLISEGANVNAQIRSDSPVLQGYTPLHIFVHFHRLLDQGSFEELIKLFVKHGANVTLQNGESETVVHLGDKAFDNYRCTWHYDHLTALLEGQRDFTVNPVRADGISHFHIACYHCNADIVEKFLCRGDIDVNQTFDYFHDDLPGTSALHLAAASRVEYCGISNLLKTVDLLLSHGAEVQAEDSCGNTPLHECCGRNVSLDVFERLARAAADVNAANICGETPLSLYLESEEPTVDGIKTLLRLGCQLNVFNAVTDVGQLGKIVHVFSYTDAHNLLSALMVNFKQQMGMDELGRTVVHNIVSIKKCNTRVPPYTALIEQISGIDCDIDSQDHSGRTALHVAAKFYNSNGVLSLLMAGADVNITDADGKTSLAYDFDDCTCRQCDKNPNDSDDEDDEDKKVCPRSATLQILASHVKHLQLCGLEVNKQNEDLSREAFEKFDNKTTGTEDFVKELQVAKNVRIGSHALALRDFLSENGAVADYPTLSETKRDDVNKFFSSIKENSFREHFPRVAGVFQLQYRKARARPYLVESAKNAMATLIGFRLPEICSHFILVLLTNYELKSVIASAM